MPQTPKLPASACKGGKRVLSTPESDNDPKKSKSYSDAIKTPPAVAEEVESNSAPQEITLSQDVLNQLSCMLTSTFNGQLESMVEKIVQGVTGTLNARIGLLEKQNQEITEENASLRARIELLELQADIQEQYSRRECLRISGVGENSGENTDDIVMDLCTSIQADISIDEIARSHRIGKQNGKKPRDIIVKFTSYRSRQKLYKRRSSLRTSSYSGTYVNEDLTKRRSQLLYKARQLVTDKLLNGTWTSDGNILIKDLNDRIRRINTDNDLQTYTMTPTGRFATNAGID